MKFVKESLDTKLFVDGVFSIADKAKKDPEAINAVIGCLCDEEGKLLTYNTVFEGEKRLQPVQRASYAKSCAGNDDYNEAIRNYILEGKVTLPAGTIATAGGTGAIYTAMHMCLQDGDTMAFPEVSWGNYRIMADENLIRSVTYDIYDFESLLKVIDETEKKAFIIINSPCENPCGHAYTYEEWEKIIDKANSSDKEIILLCDMAYIDYAEKGEKEFFELFNKISDNVLILMAISTSKSFSYYGERLGALLIISKDQKYVDNFVNIGARLLRTTWSNVNNGAMCNVADILNNHLDEFKNEVEESRLLIKKRADIFVNEAKEAGLPIYEYKSGFFVTIKFDDNDHRDEVHERLMNNHIYTVKVNKGIRIAVCSTPVKAVTGLAKKIKELY
ncbi:MAG: aminotransferase class I/II-fold pyridoxal phosphate-dependent enzyme [Erysipelotrichaceae bacterium]|nr:aminotransferase class I/II-fold pyridoxal phosphate-dependent enzyme [Erysipelotrichaceae bacterium]